MNKALATSLLSMAFLALTSTIPAAAAEPLKVGFVYPSPVGDTGWAYQHDMGRKELEKALGSKVQVRSIASVDEGPDASRVARELANDGFDLVFGTSFGYMRPMAAVATGTPGTKYVIASGYQTAANFAGYNARWHEGGYLAGVLAAKTAKTGSLGFVGSFPVPDVMWYLNAFTLGAQSVNPKVVVRTVFVNSWYDPPKERDAALSMINLGVEVLTHFTNTPVIVQAAEERGVAVISFHSDMQRFAPRNYLTGVSHQWGPFYTRVAQEVIAGTWKPGVYLGGLADGVVKLAPMGPRVSKEAMELVKAKEKEIASGKLNVFAGPIKDQKGVVRVAAGSTLPDADLGKMDWFVNGIVGGQRQ